MHPASTAMTPPFTCPMHHPYVPIRSSRILQGCHKPPWLTTSKGAHHYNFSDITQHPTYLCTHQCLDISVSPGRAQCGAAAEYCKAATRDCTQVNYKYQQHQSFRNTHTCITNHTPDHAPCTIPPTHKTPVIPTNSRPGNIG
jgi:hypothetical protein